MNKKIYQYDSHSARYVPVKKSNKNLILIISLPIVAIFSTLLSVYFVMNSSSNKDSSYNSTKTSKVELEKMKSQFETLNEKFVQTQGALNDLEERDNNIYRAYFELDTISQDIRKAGFGGINRYEEFSQMQYGELVAETTRNLDILNKQLVIQSESLDEINKIAKQKEKIFSHIPAIQPIANKELKRLASGYGMRLHPILKIGRMHWGMDFKADPGTPIYATGNGTIKRADRMGGYGNVVVIDHGFGYETLYAHLQRHNVNANQTVKRGDVIGFVGNTGLSSGPHLHYEVRKNKEKLNPISFFYNDVSPDEFKVLYDRSEELSISLD